jgi:hypothetical protein
MGTQQTTEVSTFHENSTLRTTKFSEDEVNGIDTQLIIIICSVSAVVLFITVIVCYCMANRCRNSGNTHRQRNGSESCDLYQNSEIIRYRQMEDYREIIVNGPLPLPPEMNRQPAGRPAIPEDDYLKPNSVDALWLRSKEEIRQLTPAPPVFPRDLERLPLDGEGAYTPVIADDEAPLLTPGPTHEITHNPPWCGLREESGYVVPSSLLENSLQQNVVETDLSPEPKEIKHKGNEYRKRARTVVTSHGAVQQCSDMSESRPLAEGASVSSDTRNETEMSKDTTRKLYRSSFHMNLSPPTKHRSIQIYTSTPNIAVYIRTNHDNFFTNI